MIMDKELIFIVPYFGKAPHWLKFFLLSFAANPRVHVLFVGDIQGIDHFSLPSNSSYIPIDISSLEARIQHILQVRISIKDPHKICDFRPWYGLIFGQFLAGAKYWGYCDIDLLFGDLTPALDLLNLSSPDIFSAGGDNHVAGHFTVFKNIHHINSIGFLIDDYKDKATQHHTTFMDEGGLLVAIRKVDDLCYACSPDTSILHLDGTRHETSLRAITVDFSFILVAGPGSPAIANKGFWKVSWKPGCINLNNLDSFAQTTYLYFALWPKRVPSTGRTLMIST